MDGAMGRVMEGAPEGAAGGAVGRLRVLTERAHEVDGSVREGRAWVPIAALPDLIGWTVRPEGLCRGDVCVPMAAQRRATLVVDGQIELGGTAQLLGRASVIDAEDATRPVIALALHPESRRQALDDLHAPDFVLPDLEGNGPLGVAGSEEAPGDVRQLVRLPLRPSGLAGVARRAGPSGVQRDWRRHRPRARGRGALDRGHQLPRPL